MKTVSNVLQGIKTHILRSITFSPQNRAVYDIMGKNTVQPEGHRRQYGACALRAGHVSPQTYTMNM
jgi:hypothetical protein